MTDARTPHERAAEVLHEVIGITPAHAWDVAHAMTPNQQRRVLEPGTEAPRLVQLLLEARNHRAQLDHEQAVADAIAEAHLCYELITGPGAGAASV